MFEKSGKGYTLCLRSPEKGSLERVHVLFEKSGKGYTFCLRSLKKGYGFRKEYLDHKLFPYFAWRFSSVMDHRIADFSTNYKQTRGYVASTVFLIVQARKLMRPEMTETRFSQWVDFHQCYLFNINKIELK